MNVETVLRNLRSEKGLTLEGAAEALRLSRSGYQQIETGTRSADLETATRIAGYFGVQLDAIFVPKTFSVRAIEGQ